MVAPEGKLPSHTVTAKVVRMTRDATEGEGRKRELPAREQMFTRPISKDRYLQPGPLHLTRRSDLLDVELAPVYISIYDPADTASTPDNA